MYMFRYQLSLGMLSSLTINSVFIILEKASNKIRLKVTERPK